MQSFVESIISMVGLCVSISIVFMLLIFILKKISVFMDYGLDITRKRRERISNLERRLGDSKEELCKTNSNLSAANQRINKLESKQREADLIISQREEFLFNKHRYEAKISELTSELKNQKKNQQKLIHEAVKESEYKLMKGFFKRSVLEKDQY